MNLTRLAFYHCCMFEYSILWHGGFIVKIFPLKNICQAGIFSAATYLRFETFLRYLKTYSGEKPSKAVQIFVQAGIISTAAYLRFEMVVF